MKQMIILGGGLWGGLLAYRLKDYFPSLQFTLYEQEETLGGNHTWSFHHRDVSPQALEWLRPFITQSWEGYSVSFPHLTREFSSPYYSITARQFNQVLQKRLDPEYIHLASPLSLKEALSRAEFVIDARNQVHVHCQAYQKFLGLELELHHPHHLERPVLMDAQVEQIDGYRFLYYLPWSSHSVLVEDTRYSHWPELDSASVELNIRKEVKKRSWEIKHITRRESGVLSLPLSPVTVSEEEGVISLGGIFHDTTGYSLPDAVRLIDRLGKIKSFEYPLVKQVILQYRAEREAHRKYFRALNHLMFRAAKPEERYQVLQHFYRLPGPLIERFYAGEPSRFDKIRVFLGKPPVSIASALKTFMSNDSIGFEASL